MSGRSTSQRPLSSTTLVASPKMRPLQRLIGTWLTRGSTLTPTGDPESSFTFIDRYQWLPGGHFIAHTVTGELRAAPVTGLEIIGYDGAPLLATSYDSLGLVTRYRVRLNGRNFSMSGARERFQGRFTAGGRQLEGMWERRAGRGRWRPMMQVTLTWVGP